MLGGGGQTAKNWDNCNSIINKMYFKKSMNNDSANADRIWENWSKYYHNTLCETKHSPWFHFNASSL